MRTLVKRLLNWSHASYIKSCLFSGGFTTTYPLCVMSVCMFLIGFCTTVREVRTRLSHATDWGRVVKCLAVQSSMFNDNYPHLALDKDPATCAATGWETIGPWWKVDLGSRKTVTGVTLTGTYSTTCKQAIDMCCACAQILCTYVYSPLRQKGKTKTVDRCSIAQN